MSDFPYISRPLRSIQRDARRLCALARDLYNAHPTADERLERLEADGTPLCLLLDDLAAEAHTAELFRLEKRILAAYTMLYGEDYAS